MEEDERMEVCTSLATDGGGDCGRRWVLGVTKEAMAETGCGDREAWVIVG